MAEEGEGEEAAEAEPEAEAAPEPVAPSPGADGANEQPSPPKPQTLAELWLLVAKSFHRAVELRALMVALGISTIDENERRQRRHQMELRFADHMVQNNDSMMREMALRMVPGLDDAHFEVLLTAAEEDASTANVADS